ncbi:hypothetical protein CAEBREN_04758 [Caenorhabditis brenneri]|uniref:Uncharacterized protein n=1 Tax=Caenorhabditis brenneri TaxID=135651 RepID=G0MKT8_CAEBE|nr:hypothetical protein CAEBREN_04758 [Caenorhabditis brenneri]
MSHDSAENHLFSAEFIDSFRFENHIIIRFQFTNRSENGGDLTIRVSTCSSGCSVRWLLFKNLTTINLCSVSKESEVLCVAVPFVAFYQHDEVSLNIHCKLGRNKKNHLLQPTVHSVIEQNLNQEAIPEASTTKMIHFSKSMEELELKSIEYLDEQKSIRIMQSLLTVFCCSEIPKSPDFSNFRRTFPEFLENDFYTWRLFVGVDRFDGVLVYTRNEEDNTKSFVIAKHASLCRNFIEIMNEKCFGN